MRSVPRITRPAITSRSILGTRSLSSSRPRRRGIIFTTGFSRNAVIHKGLLDKDVNFLSKPFTLEQLTAKVREVLRG